MVSRLAAAGLAVASLAAFAACGGGGGAAAVRGDDATARSDVPTVRRLLIERLDAKKLTYRYVACVANGRRFEGSAVARCNVNFNAPHIEVYCGAVRDGRLITDHEDAAVPCPRDDRGEDPPVHTSA